MEATCGFMTSVRHLHSAAALRLPRSAASRSHSDRRVFTTVANTPRGMTPFGPRVGPSRGYTESARYELYTELNDPDTATRMGAGRRSRMCSTQAEFFSSNSFYHRIARAVARAGAIDTKEFFETAEFVARTRRRVRRPCMLDLCCGHGFAGILLAAMEESVQSVLLVDARRPASFDVLMSAVGEVAPWVHDKVRFVTGDLSSSANAEAIRALAATARAAGAEGAGKAASGKVPTPGAPVGCLSVHACGALTDSCIDVAIALGGPIAAMPCCYTGAAKASPMAVTRTFGVGAAADIARTFRLEGEGYRVEWSTIPVEITPLNRVIVGIPPELRGAEAGGTVPLVRAAELRQRRQRQWKRGEDGAAESDGVVADALTELLLQLGSGGSSESSAEGVGGGGGDGQAAAAAEGAGGAGGSSSLASAANKILGGMERGRGAGGAAASSRRIVRHREEEEDVA